MHEAWPVHHSSAGIVDNITASTVAQYLAALPADRRAALSAVRKVIRSLGNHLPGALTQAGNELPCAYSSSDRIRVFDAYFLRCQPKRQDNLIHHYCPRSTPWLKMNSVAAIGFP